METLEAYMPEDVYSMVVMGVVAFIVIWLVMFVLRKLIGIAMVAILIIGGLMVWHNPAVLQTAQDAVVRYYDQWRYGASTHDDQQHL
ncbi:hypothetical protein [Rhizobium sp. Leaf262]|uniref:hypothetical protein n=1 Tax=Rhizobium sp. Leaf262 TaxID=1736312 RepID=UPI0007151249|nr:hypothetical protein [Rhizobium sp. Leaf262]KQO83428.1 hypothetical protein ASF29_00905 [Rhizobium sp. Leaf262]